MYETESPQSGNWRFRTDFCLSGGDKSFRFEFTVLQGEDVLFKQIICQLKTSEKPVVVLVIVEAHYVSCKLIHNTVL